ncbi:MAG: glutamyl-tRNA reductase [Enterobacterales bacterium]|nr:glutamyl-tRNA reductase [Enterobacterales bacterium]
MLSICLLGINHKTAPVATREKVAFSPDCISQALSDMQQQIQLDEVAIISTCNRMEIVYIDSHDASNASQRDSQPQDSGHNKLVQWLAEYHQLEANDIAEHCYYHRGKEAIGHLMSVASGLDSMVLGEPQILGQVKDAFGYAKNAGTLGMYLDRLFQQTFSLAKQVRTDTQIGDSAVSVAYAAVTLAKRIFADFEQVTALFIGAGETIELAAKHLLRQGVKNMMVANRTVERGQLLAESLSNPQLNIQVYSLSALPDMIDKADIIISSTASPVPIIGKGLMEKAIVSRRHRSVFMVDLAVPRDIEPQVSDISDIYLYTVDDMQDVIQENLKVRETAAKEAKNIILQHCDKYLSWVKGLSSVSLLKAFRGQIEQTKQHELKRALAKLDAQATLDKQQSEKNINRTSQPSSAKIYASALSVD